MSKDIFYKIDDYGIAIDICDKDVPCVKIGKYLTKDVIEDVFGYYSKDVVDFFLTVINKLKAKDQRIAELEEQLKNAIVPKFDLGQKVYLKENLAYYVDNRKPRVIRAIVIGFVVSEDFILYELNHNDRYIGKFYENELFATKEEAQAKLEELKGETK